MSLSVSNISARVLSLSLFFMVSLSGCQSSKEVAYAVKEPAGKQMASKWRVTCKGGTGPMAVPIFWEVKKYNERSGKLDLIVTDRDGLKGSAKAKINGNQIEIFGSSGKFDDNFNFSIAVDICPGGMVGVAI